MPEQATTGGEGRSAEVFGVDELRRRFPDEDSCRAWLEEVVWGGEPACPRCGAVDDIGRPPPSRPHNHWCKGCRRYFTVTTGTALHAGKKPLRDWIYAIYGVMTARKGVSAMRLSKELSCQYRTAWHMLGRIREACRQGDFFLQAVIEADETYIGGKERNKHFRQEGWTWREGDGKRRRTAPNGDPETLCGRSGQAEMFGGMTEGRGAAASPTTFDAPTFRPRPSPSTRHEPFSKPRGMPDRDVGRGQKPARISSSPKRLKPCAPGRAARTRKPAGQNPRRQPSGKAAHTGDRP